MNIRSILIAEDDPRDEQLALAALEEYSLANKIFIVRDGEETLDYLYCRGKYQTRTGGDPVAVLLDLKMPKVNGLEVLRTIKADPRLKSIPIVVLTSSREEADVAECYQHGANAYVVKPLEFNDFRNAVKQLGVFWSAVNEPPPDSGSAETPVASGEVNSPEKNHGHEILVTNSALGRRS